MSFFEWRDAPVADFAVIGDPIHHSLSPRLHAAAYLSLGISARYLAIRVPQMEFFEAISHLAHLGYRGLNVTLPNKEQAYSLGYATSPFVNRIGAVNTLTLHPARSAANTDAPALLTTLQSRKPGGHLLILGAGGSARAAYVALGEAGYQLSGWNRTPARLAQLLSDLGLKVPILGEIELHNVDAVINATSTSLSGDVPPVKWSTAPPDMLVYDLAYASGQTPILARAQAAGLQTLDGREMLVEQGALAFELWFGKEAPRQDMMKAIL